MAPYLMNYEWGYEWGHLTTRDLLTTDLKSLACTILLLILIYKVTRLKTDKNLPPFTPYSSMSIVREIAAGRMPWVILNSAREVGSTFILRIFHRKIVIINDANVTREILRDSSQEKTSGYNQIKALHGQQHDILSTRDSSWNHARMAMAPAFSSRHIRRMNAVVVKHTENFITNKLDQMMEEGLAFDVGEEMIWLTLDIICDTAFEYELSHDEKISFRSEADIVMKEASRNHVTPLRWIFGYLNPATKRARAGTKILVDIALKVINSYNQLESPIQGTVIDCIMKNQSYKNDNERAADIIILLFAGHDTTAYSIAWILIELARNPIDQAMLHKKLKSATSDERKDTNMLGHVIKEGLRLHPVAANGFGRMAQKDIIVKQKGSNLDFTISKGTRLFMPSFSRHRDADYYEDPDVFRPSRWENPSEKAVSAFMPYALGKRNCIGQSLANAELHSILALLLYEYHFSIEDEGVAYTQLTMKPKGFRLKVTRS